MLPFGGQQRGLELFGQHGNEGHARFGGNEAYRFFRLSALRKARGHQLFNDRRPGRGGSQSLSLGIFRHILFARRLHGRQQRILSEVFGRGRFSLLDLAGGNGKQLPLGKLRKGAVLLALFRVYPPTHMKDCFPFGGKGISAAVQPCLGLQIDEGCADRHKHLTGGKAQDLPFACGQRLQVRFARCHGGNDGVVVADLFAAAHLPRTDGCGRLRAADARAAQRQRVYAALHIVGEIAAVGAGIGAELLFVEALQVIQRLLRRVPK